MSPLSQLPTWQFLLFSAGSLGILSYLLTKHLRYGLRQIVLNLFCVIQGRRHQWINDPTIARKLLSSSSSKGIGLEQLLSTKAFCPVISLESINDKQWIRMKDNFILLKSQLPPLDSLANITRDLTSDCLDNDKTIDCPTMVQLIVQIMTTWLFAQEEDDEEEEEFALAMVTAAVEEFRKEIAIKGRGDPRLKLFVIKWIQDKIKRNSKIYDIFQEEWFNDEYWSLLLQPFIISPAINITDIAVTIASAEFQEKYKIEQGGKELLQKNDMERIILSGINYNHPFPVLERWFPNGLREGDDNGPFIVEENTQVFIPIDEIAKKHCSSLNQPNNWSAFGAGKRACGGREIAMTLCIEMFHVLLTHERGAQLFKPWINHNYSGRDNDLKESWSQSWFQASTLAQILWKLVFKKA